MLRILLQSTLWYSGTMFIVLDWVRF